MPTTTEEAEKRQLYNRQEYVVGAETQAKYGATDVLVVGACGLGAEIVKNLALTGVRSITVADTTPATLQDLGTNFFLTPADVGRPRAEVVVQKAQELNRFVRVAAAGGGVPVCDLISHAHVVIFANAPTTRLVAENAKARQHGVKFVACESRGVAGCVFVDAGSSFDVLDPDGEETVSCVVTSITGDGLVTLPEDKKHECEVGSRIFFTGVVSPAQMNSTVDPSALYGSGHSSTALKLFEVAEVISPYTLRLQNFAAALGGGSGDIDLGTGAYLHTTKRQVHMSFDDLATSVKAPAFANVFDSEEKLSAPATLHALFQALHQHSMSSTDKHSNATLLPVSNVDGLVQAAAKLCGTGAGDFDAAAARLLAGVAHGMLNPMVCLIGGLASQEVLKVCSGKFTPVHQWLYYDAREVLRARGDVSDELRRPQGTRYDGQVAVLGAAFQAHLAQQRAFIVGAGALGCELIKNAACVGLGGVSITDMDTIEMSNLSRQFLFRNSHIGRHKSQVACEAAKHINTDLQVQAFVEKVGPETEGIFNGSFWDSHTVIINALDNVSSRKYVDTRCLFFKRPLFESGTLGTKCNTQCVIPYCTESYGSSYDPPEKAIPLCTLKNFPNAIEHTIQWARDNFFAVFTNTPQDVNSYLDDANAFESALQRDPAAQPLVLKAVNTALRNWPADDKGCVRLARLMYHEYFNETFRHLLHNLPLDKRTESGELFWSGAKKPPTPLTFRANSGFDVDFVYHCAYLLAQVYGLPGFNLSRDEVGRLAEAVPIPDFVARQAVFATSETEKKEEAAAQLADDINISNLPPVSQFVGRRMLPQEFEKDDTTNHHVEYITFCSNLRAEAYSIPPADVHHTKRIAGNIIPAMVTTTALVTGLVGLEVLKYLLLTHRHSQQGGGGVGGGGGAAKATAQPLTLEEITRQLSLYRNAFVNIALPFMAFSDPIIAAGKIYELPDGQSVRWGIWDRIDVDEGRDVTVEELVTLLESRYQVEIFIIALVSGKMLYAQFGNKGDRSKTVSAVVRARGEEAQEGEDYCCFVATGVIGEVEADIPLVRYKYRNF